MAICLLGPLTVDGSEHVSPRDRVVLSALALEVGDVVPAERLADALWGDELPRSWAKVVQGSVVRLRRTLGRSAVETSTGGYRLAVPEGDVDVVRFERLLDQARSQVAQADDVRAVATLTSALALWRGPALRDVEHWTTGRQALARLQDERRDAEELLVERRLATGADVVVPAQALCSAEPLRERRWGLLATAQYRAGRQADALASLRHARAVLRDELGVDPGPELQALEQAVLRHDRSLQVPAPRAAGAGPCPYRGLLAFESEHADVFFGRDDDVAGCLRVLAVAPLLVVAGPSGAGKSSLVRAGVLPALERGRPVPVLVPGSDPMGALVAALSVPRRAPVVVVDQLEEVLGDRHAGAAAAFLGRLVALVRAGEQVVVTVRADALGGLAVDPAFARLAERGLHLLGPLTEADLRAAIEGPARAVGLQLEHGLVELLLREVEGEPGALPLLSHALAETWQRRDAGVLTVDGYRSTGGVRSAVARSAELLHDALPPAQRPVLRALLLRLVSSSDSGAVVVTRVPLATLVADRDRHDVVDRLVSARLVTADESTLGLAHESLATAWPRLRAWLDDDVDGARLLRHLTVAAEDWDARGRSDADLYRGARREAASEWRSAAGPDLTALEAAFLTASDDVAAAEREAAVERRRQRARLDRRLRSALSATVAGLVVALVAGGAAVTSSRHASATARAAAVDRLVAESAALRGTRRDLAALLAVEAQRLRPDAASADALLGVLTATPGFLGYERGTGAPVAGAQVLADGRTVLTVRTDGALALQDVGGGPVSSVLRAAHAGGGALVGASRDGRAAAVVTWEPAAAGVGTAWLGLLDVGSRTWRRPQVRLPLDVGAVAVSDDGGHVAVSGYGDGRALVYDATSGTAVTGTAATDPLPELASVDAVLPAGVVEVGPVPGQERTRPLVRATAALAFRADGSLLVGSESGPLRVVDPVTGRATAQLAGAPRGTSSRQVVAAPDGTVVASGPAGVVAWSAEGRLRWNVTVPEQECASLAVLATSSTVLCGGASGAVSSLDLGTGAVTRTRYDLQRGPVAAVAVSGDQQTLEVFSATEAVLGRWRTDGTGPLVRRLALPGAGGPLDRDGRRILVDAAQGPGPTRPVLVAEVPSGRVLGGLGGDVMAVWTADPDRAVSWGQQGQGRVRDVRTGEVVVGLRGAFWEPPQGAGTSRGPGRGRVVAWVADLGDVDAVYEVWDVGTGAIVRAAQVLRLTWAGLTPDGSTVLTVADGRATSRRLADGAVLGTTSDVVTAAIATDQLLVTSTSAGGLRLLDPHTLQPSGRQVQDPGPVSALAVDERGSVAGALGADGLLRVYDLVARTQLGQPVPAPAGADGVALRADGRVLSVRVPGGAVLWDLDPAHWPAAACRLAGRVLTDAERRSHLADVAGSDRPCEGSGSGRVAG